MDKSPDAFRTISEVAETLETPAHVLRFWESRFPQIRPVKRAGGRRYYRPADVALLSGIRHLLHDEGLTIRGVQKILREQGVRHVASLAGGTVLPEEEDEAALAAVIEAARAETQPEVPDSAEIVPLTPQPRPPLAPDEALGDVLRLYPAAATPPEPVLERQAEVTAPARPAAEAAPPSLPLYPEAGHVWVEDEPELDLAVPRAPVAADPPATQAPFPRRIAPRPEPAPKAPPPRAGMFDDLFIAEPPARVPPKLSGLAARLRALPQPLSPRAVAELTELHSRLGLLQAQMAEALRMRR